MMEFSFFAYGHPNIRSRHRNTFEFTKDSDLTVAGDCIIGINADFKVPGSFLEGRRILFELDAGGITETVTALLNQGFCDDSEMVVRKSEFISNRTFATCADKASVDFSKEFRDRISEAGQRIHVRVSQIEETAKKG